MPQKDQPVDISRRNFIKATGMGALAAGIGTSVFNAESVLAAQEPIAPRPSDDPISAKPYNVMVILTDQEHYYSELLGKGHWPGRDRLAKMGTTFENHQICSAVCTPSRSVIFTGQHIQHTKMFDNTNFPWVDNLSFNIPTIGHMMREAGYYTTYHGKWHLNGDLDIPQDGKKKLIGYDLMDRYGFSDFNGLGDEIGMTLGGYHNDQISTAMAQAWLRNKGKTLNQEDKPWFLTLGLVNPHDVMFYNTDQPGEKIQEQKDLACEIVRDPDDKTYKKEWDQPLSPSRKQSWEDAGRPQAQLEYQKCRQLLVGQFPNEDARWKRLQDYYLNCISDCDRSVDNILTELDDLDMLHNTIVIFTSDHGELCGAHGMHGKGSNAFREQNNVPYIIYHPDIQGGQKCQALTSHLDLVPTILAMTGADKKQKPEVQKNLHGHDISKVLNNPETTDLHAIRSGALYCFNMWSYMDATWLQKMTSSINSGKKLNPDTAPRPDTDKRSAIRTVFDGRYKFNRYFRPSEHNRPTNLKEIYEVNDVELFDLKNDPYEMHNLGLYKMENAKLILAMNDKLNTIIDQEVGSDKGEFLPDVKGVNWAFEQFDF